MRVPKLLRSTALAAGLIAASVPSLSVPANAAWGGWHGGWGGWHGGGWGWGGVGLGLAAGALVGAALTAPYWGGYGYPYGYGYPAYAYGYGYPAYGYGYGYGPSVGYGYNYGTRYAYHPRVYAHRHYAGVHRVAHY